jgi:desulfoferrodoxin-like iron-binding protein
MLYMPKFLIYYLGIVTNGINYRGLKDARIKVIDSKRSNKVAGKKAGDKYSCSICGNVVILAKVGGGTLVCCGKPMDKIS